MGKRGIFGEYSCTESRGPLELPSTVSGFLSFGLNQHFFFKFLLLSLLSPITWLNSFFLF